DQRGSGAAQINQSPAVAIARPIHIFILQVQDVYDLLSCKDSCAQRSGFRDKRVVSAVFGKPGRHAPCRGTSEAVAVTSPELAECRSAQMHRLFEYRLEHGSELAVRGIDGLQDFRCRRLPRQSRVEPSGALLQPLLRISKSTLKIGNDLLWIG